MYILWCYNLLPWIHEFYKYQEVPVTCRYSVLGTRDTSETKPDPCPNGAYILVGKTLYWIKSIAMKSGGLSPAAGSAASGQASLGRALGWRELPHPRSWTLPSAAYIWRRWREKSPDASTPGHPAWELPVGLAEEFVQPESRGPTSPFAQSCFFHFPSQSQSLCPEEPNMKWYYIITRHVVLCRGV